MKKMIKTGKRITSCILSAAMAVSLAAGIPHPEKAHAEYITLRNPRISVDSSMDAGQRVTYDCVWFGSYPQTEVKEGDSIYASLQAATAWDANNDIVIGGTKYRRMQKGDATYATSGRDNYYDWEDDTTYHYFRYEPVKWRVLETDGRTAMLLSDVALDDQMYNTKYEDTTWETSTIRSWLNGYGAGNNQESMDYSSRNFIDSAFSKAEQDAIVDTNVVNDDNIYYGTEGGNDTADKLFLLSEKETYTETAAVHGFVSDQGTYDEARRCKSSDYAKAMGVWSSTSEAYKGNCYWWLRSPGYSGVNAISVDYNGYVDLYGSIVNYSNYGVRVALNLNLSSSNLYTYAGTVCSDGTGSDRPGSDITPTVISANNITFSVYDIGKGRSLAKPMQDAQVTADGFGSTVTDVAGQAEITNTLTDSPVTNTKCTISKEGYRTYYYYKDIYKEGAQLLWNNNSNYVLMRELQDGDNVNPYVSTLMCQPEYGSSYDAMTIQKAYNYNGSAQKLAVQMNAVWNGRTPASYILYQKDGKSYESTDGKFVLDMGGDFDSGKPVYAKLVAADGTAVEEKTQWEIKGQSGAIAGNSLDLIDTGSSDVLGEDVPFLSGEKVSIKLKKVKMDVSVDSGKVKVIIGKKKDAASDEVFSNQEWEEWKKLCEHQPKDLNLSQWKNVLESIDTPITGSAKASTEVYGYLEGSVAKSGDTLVTGKLKLSTSLSAGIQAQYTVGVVPVYAKVSLGVNGSAEGKLSYNFTKKELDSENTSVTLTIEPELKAEGGVGVMAVATVGVEGTGTLPITTNIGTDETKCSLKGKMALKAKLLGFEYSLDLAEAEYKIFPKEETQQAGLSGVSIDDFRLSDRNYTAKKSIWRGNKEVLPKASSAAGGTERVLKTNICPDSEMQIVDVGNTKMILWTEEDTSRENINDSKLVYSIYDSENDTWSEPLAVADDGTADYAPCAVSDGGHVYVAWQNLAEKLDGSADLKDMAASSSIAMSVWTGEAGFSDEVTLSEAGNTAVLPKIALDSEGNPFVVYLQNTDKNLLLTTGTNTVMCAARKGGVTERKAIVADAGLVTSLDAAYTDDYEASYTVDRDGDLSTLGDRELLSTKSTATENSYMDSNVQYVENKNKTYRFWYQDGIIKSQDEEGNESTVYQDDTGKLTDDFSVISGKENQMAVVWTASDEEGHRQIEGALYDADGQKWGNSVQISDTDADVYHPQGIFDADGNLQFLYKKTGTEQTDLCVLTAEKAVNLKLENAYCDETALEAGSTGKVSVLVKNTGTRKADGYSIDIDGTVTSFPDTLEAGESIVAEADYKVPEDFGIREITVRADTENETDASDNQISIQIGHSDLAVNVTQNNTASGQLTQILVANESCVDTPATLNIHKNSRDGEILESIYLGTVSKGQLVSTDYLWNRNTNNYADDVEKIYFDVVSEKPEQYTDNNYDFVVADEMETLLSSISAAKAKTRYLSGDKLDTDDITVTAQYSDGVEKEVTGYRTNAEEIDMSGAGEKVLEISYEENGITETAQIKITVEGKPEPDTEESSSEEPSTEEPSTEEPPVTVTDISAAAVTLAESVSEYDGSEKYPVVTQVTLGAKNLQAGTDYGQVKLTAKDAGSYTVFIYGIGSYNGQACCTYTIKPKSIKSKSIKASLTSGRVFTGKKIRPAVKVKDALQALVNGSDYSLTYKNNTKVGTATVVIKGKGNYTGTFKKTFRIVPGKAAVKKAVNVKGKKLKVYFGKAKGAAFYNVSYRIKGKSKWITIKTKKNTAVIPGLKKNKTYQIKVSAAAGSKGKIYKGAYSKVVSVKIKK